MCNCTHLAIGPAECQLCYTATGKGLSRAQTAILQRTAPTWQPPWTKTTLWGHPLHHLTHPACRTSSVPTRQLPPGSCSWATTSLPSVMTRAAPRVPHIFVPDLVVGALPPIKQGTSCSTFAWEMPLSCMSMMGWSAVDHLCSFSFHTHWWFA